MKSIKEFKNKIICGDCLEILKEIPDNSIDCIITSPPYWGLRNYKVDGQIGLEHTLEEYLEKLLKITAELKRILKPTGILFWNHGDCYGSPLQVYVTKQPSKTGFQKPSEIDHRYSKKKSPTTNPKAKCLALQNYRLILKMINEQSWILRNIIIWYKPNHMPSSVKDRFTNTYEPVFMLVKKKKYYFNLDAVRVPIKQPQNINQASHNWEKRNTPNPIEWRKYAFNYRVSDAEKKSEKYPQFMATKEEIERYKKEKPNHHSGNQTIHGQRLLPQQNQKGTFHQLGKNPGDLWSISTQPAPSEARGKHFAIFPEKLVEPMILAGCPKDGIVLDPFCGSGTTCVVAKKLGRNYIGIDISKEYCEIAEKRLENTHPSLIF
jgi:DNA modification methylase